MSSAAGAVGASPGGWSRISSGRGTTGGGRRRYRAGDAAPPGPGRPRAGHRPDRGRRPPRRRPRGRRGRGRRPHRPLHERTGADPAGRSCSSSAGTVPVTWRRRAPVLVWAVVGAATGAYGIAELPDPVFVGAFVSLYTVVARCPPRTSVPIGVATAALWLLATASSGDSDLNDYYPAVVLAVLAGALGVLARTLERERQEDARRAVAEERARLARELHDVVAHAVSMVVVQAEAGAAAGGPPDRVEETFDAIADTGRTALGELRRLPGRAARRPTSRVPGSPSRGGPARAAWSSRAAGRAARRGAGGGRRAAAPARRRPLRLPHRPGGADQQRASTPARPGRRSSSATASATSSWRWSTTARAPAASPPPPATGWRRCASAPPCSAASSTWGRAPGGGFAVRARLPARAVAGDACGWWWSTTSRWCGPGFRTILEAVRHRGGRRGGRRRRGGGRRPPQPARRRAHGRPHAGPRRDRGHPAAGRARSVADPCGCSCSPPSTSTTTSTRRCGPGPAASSSRTWAGRSWWPPCGWWPRGDALLAPSVTRRLLEEFARPRPSGDRLAGQPRRRSPRGSAEVLALVARGRSNAEIAASSTWARPR